MRPMLLPAVLAASLVAGSAGAVRAEGDAGQGERVFRTCAACHSVEERKNKVGPSLHDVIGRTPGTAEGFRYSAAMQSFGESGYVWDEATLNTYLEAPRKLVKGTKMMFTGLKSQEQRQDVIAYLRQFSD